MADEFNDQERRLLYGRRQGHKLKGRQAELMQSLLPGLAIDLRSRDGETPAKLFGPDIDDVRIEIGFGGGEHLAAEADAHMNVGFIGAEPFVNGVAKLLSAVDEQDLKNVRVHAGDARELLDWLGDASVSEVFLLYPDPWPKKRHHKRRFVARDNLDRLHRVLKPGGIFMFASDIQDYVRWTLREMLSHGGFEWTAQSAVDWRNPPEGWQGTRYEQKAVREGRTPAYLEFRRK
ncbi:MAG: tRNA (guanosine(46)-N7)-methyltransferase TrmB [Hyphomicrobiales bacterium]